MKRRQGGVVRWVVAGLLSGLVATALADDADDRLAQIGALKPPAYDRTKAGNADYDKSYLKDYDAWVVEGGKLVWAFAEAYPDHANTAKLIAAHWSSLKGPIFPVAKERIDAAIRVIGTELSAHPKLALDPLGKYYLATYRQLGAGADAAKLLEIANSFTDAYPKDPNGLNLVRTAAEATTDPAKKSALYQRIVDAYPDSPFVPLFKGTVRRLGAVGKPFSISFVDAISGRTIDSASLKGKVVLVDFWATWCAPCLANMPDLKKLYATYKPKGFEIVGVSLDQSEDDGGLQALKDYVGANDVKWPQYYQGNGWNGEFSTSWGILAIPTAFLIDKKGVLRSVDAGQNLETQIQGLLKE